MSIINKILSDFHYCTNLPIQFLDEDFKQFDFMGHNPTEIPTFATENLSSTATSAFTTDDTYHYIALYFNETSHQKGYFLIGPYQSLSAEDHELTYKPCHLTPHFEELILSIIKKNIAITMESNPHIAKGIKYIHENYHQSINLQMLCDHLNLNTCYFCVLFKNQMNMTFSQYLNQVRINESKKLLELTNDTIIDVSLSVGFNNHNHFSATFKKLTGVTPTVYRNQLKEAKL